LSTLPYGRHGQAAGHAMLHSQTDGHFVLDTVGADDMSVTKQQWR